MDSKEIYNKLLNISPPECNYVVFPCNNSRCFWGKDKESNVVYMLTSTAIKLPAIYQKLDLYYLLSTRNAFLLLMVYQKARLCTFWFVKKKNVIK